MLSNTVFTLTYFMNKDAILASIIGFGIGLLITGAILVGPSMLPYLKNLGKKGNVKSAATQTSPTPAVAATATTATFSIDTPSDQTIANDTTLTVTGHAQKGTTVVLDDTEDEAVTTATDANTFSGQITIKEGINNISVSNVSDQTQTTKHVTVFYTPKS